MQGIGALPALAILAPDGSFVTKDGHDAVRRPALAAAERRGARGTGSGMRLTPSHRSNGGSDREGESRVGRAPRRKNGERGRGSELGGLTEMRCPTLQPPIGAAAAGLPGGHRGAGRAGRPGVEARAGAWQARSDPDGADFPWLPRPVRDVETAQRDLNTRPVLVAFCEGSPAPDQAAIAAALLEVAEERRVAAAAAAAAGGAGGKDELVLCTATKPGGIGKQVPPGLCSTPLTPPPP